MQNIPIDLRDLAHDRSSIAALAAHLIADVHGGEDLAQESIYRLLRSGGLPAHGNRLAWLRTTIRRLAATEHRGRGNRQQREQEAARPEAVLSSGQIAERAELCQRVHRAIDSLPREQANVLRDHYFGGLATSEIADRDGISTNTAKSRIRRARTALRGALERDGIGDDVHWSIALAPLVPFGASAPAGAGLSSTLNGVAGAALIMNKLVSVAVLLVALVVGLQVILPDGGGEGPPPSNEMVSRDLTLPSGGASRDDPLDPEGPDERPLAEIRRAVDVKDDDDVPDHSGPVPDVGSVDSGSPVIPSSLQDTFVMVGDVRFPIGGFALAFTRDPSANTAQTVMSVAIAMEFEARGEGFRPNGEYDPSLTLEEMGYPAPREGEYVVSTGEVRYYVPLEAYPFYANAVSRAEGARNGAVDDCDWTNSEIQEVLDYAATRAEQALSGQD